jgi:uncharacterized membrane protein
MLDATSTAAFPPETGTTPDERTMATLAHVLQLLGGWIAPLVIFFVKRQSRFVTFHALQVLLFEGVCLVFTMFVMAGIFIAIALGVGFGGFSSPRPSSAPPVLFFAFFGVFWLGFIVLWFGKLLLAIIYGIKAGRGEWSEYPLLGRLARRILNIGPSGTLINL